MKQGSTEARPEAPGLPPKVMSLEVVERIDKILDTVKFGLTTAASVAVFIVLIGLF